MAEHAELIENAFVSYLSGLSGWSSNLLILAGENNTDKNDARIVCYVDDLGEEYPAISSNRITDVTIELRTPFTKLTAQEKASGTQEPLDEHKANAAALRTAINDTGLPELLSNTTTFTCFGVVDRQPTRNQDPNYWSSGYKVRIYSAPQGWAT